MMRKAVATLLLAALSSACGLIGDGSAPEPVAPEDRSAPDVTVTPSEEVFAFAVLGDFGTGEGRQREVAERMCAWHSRKPFDTVFTTGDNIYPDGDPDLFKTRFLDVYDCLFDRGVGFRSVVGNHDVMTKGGHAQLDEPAFGMPAFNYVVRAGGVRFVMADSTRLDRTWLRRKVRAATDARATVVVMHHPVFSAGTGHGSTPGFEDLHGMFRRAGVDLVFHGHDHVYTSTKKIDGVRYVVTGGGGAKLGGCRPVAATARCSKRYHFLYGEVRSVALVMRVVSKTGEVFHRFRVPLAAG